MAAVLAPESPAMSAELHDVPVKIVEGDVFGRGAVVYDRCLVRHRIKLNSRIGPVDAGPICVVRIQAKLAAEDLAIYIGVSAVAYILQVAPPSIRNPSPET